MGGREVPPLIAHTETKTLSTNWQEFTLSTVAPIDGNPVFGTRVTFSAGAGDTIEIDSVTMTTTTNSPNATKNL